MSASTTLPSAHRAAALARSALDHYRRPLPRLRATASQRHAPTVYFCTPDYNVPSGGIRVAYRHVDLLNAAGIPAAILHRREDFRCTWFENRTRVLSSARASIGPDDLVVVSELGVSLRERLPPGFRFVVFNQNPHLTWRRVPEAVVHGYANSPDLAAILTVSSYSAEMLRLVAPSANVLRLHNSIDPRLFFDDPAPRRRTIAYMPRRGRDEARQVLGILRGAGALAGWEVMPIDGVSEREVGERLRSALIFLSFAYHEGFGLPAAEAMACGAYVVGFHGFGGREFFQPQFSSPVEAGDVVGFARTVEQVVQREALQPGWCEARGAAAASFIAAEYSPGRERQDVVGTYASLMDRG
jgi:Glycosyl transferases group 1